MPTGTVATTALHLFRQILSHQRRGEIHTDFIAYSSRGCNAEAQQRRSGWALSATGLPSTRRSHSRRCPDDEIPQPAAAAARGQLGQVCCVEERSARMALRSQPEGQRSAIVSQVSPNWLTTRLLILDQTISS